MPAPGQSWRLNDKVVVSALHSLAISSGIFRLIYRCYISRFGWEDTWAVLALLTDVGCLLCSWLQRSTPLHPSKTAIILDWVVMVVLTSVPWAARLSMVATIIRITNPDTSMRRVFHVIGIAFGLMWIATLGQKSYICATRLCAMTMGVAISQLTTDVISDAFLVIMPFYFLKGVRILRRQRMLLLSSFSAAICITIVSIAHSVFICLLPLSSSSLLFAHVKAAIAFIVCNLLVIMTFIYQSCHKTDIDPGGILTGSGDVQLTTVIHVPVTLLEECDV